MDIPTASRDIRIFKYRVELTLKHELEILDANLPLQHLPAHLGRPFVDLGEGPAHERGALRVRERVRDPKRLNSLFVVQQLNRPRPVGAPQATVQAERLENLAHWLPDVRVWERLMGQCAGPGDLDGHIVVRCERDHVGQITEWLRRRRRQEGLGQT